jgi:hypothetical protein
MADRRCCLNVLVSHAALDVCALLAMCLQDDGKGISRSWVAVGTSSGAVKLYDSSTGDIKWQTNSCNEG